MWPSVGLSASLCLHGSPHPQAWSTVPGPCIHSSLGRVVLSTAWARILGTLNQRTVKTPGITKVKTSWDSAGEGLGVSKNQVPSHYAGRELSCHGRPLGLDNEDPGQGNAKHCISTLSFVAARAPCKDQPHCYYSQWPQDKPTLSSHLRLGLILLEHSHDGNDHEHLPGQDPSGVFWCLRPRRLVCHCCVDLPSELAHSPI